MSLLLACLLIHAMQLAWWWHIVAAVVYVVTTGAGLLWIMFFLVPYVTGFFRAAFRAETA